LERRARTFSYDGKVDSCNAIDGNIRGPDNGILRLEGRISGCVRVNGDGELWFVL
jgi:hypothetical protein